MSAHSQLHSSAPAVEARMFPAPAAVPWLLIGLPVLILLGRLWPVLHEPWMVSSTYSHGYLVLLLAGWLAVREVSRGAFAVSGPSWIGLVALLAVVTTLYAARVVDVRTVQQLTVPALVVAALWAGGGWTLARRFVIPAGYLCFAFSIWDYLIEPLREMTTAVVGTSARATGIPVYIVGNSIHIPSGTFEIEGGCSGLRYVIVGAALSVLCALTQYHRFLPRIALISAVLVLSVVANWIRVYVIVLAGHLTDMQHFLVSVDHYYFGWVLFAVIVFPSLYWVSPRARNVSEESDVSSTGVDTRCPVPRLGLRAAIAPIAAVAVTAVVAADVAPYRSVHVQGAGPSTSLAPAEIADWRLDGVWDDYTRPVFAGPDAEMNGRYESQGRELFVYAAGYVRQRQGAELIYYANSPIPDRDVILSTESVGVEGGDVVVRSYRVRDREGRLRQVWVGYRVAGFWATRDSTAKAYQVLGALMGRRDAQAFVLSVRCETDCQAAAETLREAGPTVLTHLLGAISAARPLS